MKAKTITYATWVTVITAVLAAISFLMLALSLHHSTRSAAVDHNGGGGNGDGGGTGLGMHDGDI